MQRLTHITPAELGGKAHQSQDIDNKLDQWLMYAMFVCSCPPVARESTKDLYSLIFPSLKSGSDAHVVRAPLLTCQLVYLLKQSMSKDEELHACLMYCLYISMFSKPKSLKNNLRIVFVLLSFLQYSNIFCMKNYF